MAEHSSVIFGWILTKASVLSSHILEKPELRAV